MPQLKKIILTDDDEVTNFINENILIDLNIAEDIKVFTDGSKAFQYILESYHNHKSLPDMVIFDDNMPMSGKEFIEELCKEFPSICNEVVFVLLGSSLRQKDIDAFESLGVQEFIEKPLTESAFLNIFRKYWKDMEATVMG